MLLRENQGNKSQPDVNAAFLNYRGKRLTPRSVGRLVKKYVRLLNINWDLHPHSLRHAFATHLRSTVQTCERFRNCSDTLPFRRRRNTRTPPCGN